MNVFRLCSSMHRQPLKLLKSLPKYSTHPFKFMEVENKWKKNDNVSKNWELIYKAPMENVVKWAQTYVTVTTGLVTCSAIYYGILLDETPNYNDPIFLPNSNVVIADNIQECLIYLGAFILCHVAVKIVLSKYVLRLYKSGDSYLAVYNGHIHNTIQKHKFHLNDFKRLKPPLISTWGDARFSLGSRHGIIFDNYFKSPQYFNYLLYKQRIKCDDEYELFHSCIQKKIHN